MSYGLYDGPVPPSMIRVSPSGELGQIMLRATCIQGIFEVPDGGVIIDPSGTQKVNTVVRIVGVMGGKEFNFRVDETMEDLLIAMDNAEASIILERMTAPSYPQTVMKRSNDDDEPVN